MNKYHCAQDIHINEMVRMSQHSRFDLPILDYTCQQFFQSLSYILYLIDLTNISIYASFLRRRASNYPIR